MENEGKGKCKGKHVDKPKFGVYKTKKGIKRDVAMFVNRKKTGRRRTK